MTKQSCESRVMTEYHTRKPYFITGHDDIYPSCTHNATPCDEMWKKFELYMTPPNSPMRDAGQTDDQAPQLVPVGADSTLPSANCFDDVDISEYQNQWDSTITDYSELDDVVYADLEACRCSNDQKLIKDCMWNGVGHKASTILRKAHNRTTSPQSVAPCHPNGCVDPRNIFPYPVGLTTTTEHKTTVDATRTATQTASLDGAETPSDSEEEIDVVTVEKSQNATALKAKTGASPKIVATLVPNEDGQLAFVTSAGSSLSTKGLVRTIARNAETDRGRAKNKFHLITTASGPKIPRVAEQTSATLAGRRHTTDETQNLMKMANPKRVMQRGNDSLSPVARFDKKRILSLEGVSFCATTKVRRDPDDNEIVMTEFGVYNQNVTPVEIKEQTEGTRIRIQPVNKRKRKAEVLAKMLPPGAGSDTEQIRAAHNVLERQRREGLRTSFLTLRDNVPELQRQEKTPKVHILNKARDYCLELQRTEANLAAEKERLRARSKRLAERLVRAQSAANPTRLPESDLESDYEDSSVSPLSSLPPSPSIFSNGGYYIARRVSQEGAGASAQELVLRLEPAGPKRAVSTLKQTSAGIRAFIAPVSKSPGEVTNSRGSGARSDAMSDGFECLSEEETVLL